MPYMDEYAAQHVSKTVVSTVVDGKRRYHLLPPDTEVDQRQVPQVGPVDRLWEMVYLALTRLQIVVLSSPTVRALTRKTEEAEPWSGHRFGPLSVQGLFNSHYIEPMFLWWGLNTRVLLSAPVGRVDVRDSFGNQKDGCVNGASHNYAGFYVRTREFEQLHRLCLDVLPVMTTHKEDSQQNLLCDAVHDAIAKFWDADFCVTTATGYGSNYVALPPLLSLLANSRNTTRVVVVMDEHCHNSIFTGVYLGIGQLRGRGSLRKFAHNNTKQLESILEEINIEPNVKVLVIIEGLYSMEGDVPPLVELHHLKQRHGFLLYCDEAHSFLSLGRTGRGCLEHYYDEANSAEPMSDLIDIRTGTLSKAVGGIGGYIAGKACFADCITRHSIQEKQEVSSATLVQTLWVLRQPRLIRHNLSHLATMARHCRQELLRLGVFVYGSGGTPILPVWTGRSCMSARFSYELRRRGVLASPVTTPAVPFWESRVRVNLSADFSDEDVDRLIEAIVSAAVSTGVINKSGLRRGAMPPRPFGFKHACCDCSDDSDDNDDNEVDSSQESQQAFESIQSLILAQKASSQSILVRPPGITEAGHASRQEYGVGSGSSRWISGTFPCHMAVETLLARATGTNTAMTFADASIGLASTVAALARPVRNARKHMMLFPVDSQLDRFARQGLFLIPPTKKGKKSTLDIVRYNRLSHLVQYITDTAEEDTCFTVYLQHPTTTIEDDNQRLLLLRNTIAKVAEAAGQRAVTILLNDTSSSPDPLRLDHIVMPFLHKKNMHAMVYGHYRAGSDVSIAYLAGPEALVRELRYTSRGYMYTTSTPPFIMEMLCAALKSRVCVGEMKQAS